MTKHDHIESQIRAVLATVSGLTVLSAGSNLDDVNVRPCCRLQIAGEMFNGDMLAEAISREVRVTVVAEVYIADEGTGLTTERNRLAQAIEYACDTSTIANYADAQYRIETTGLTYESASGVFDDGGDRAAFVVTITTSYINIPL